MNDFERRPREHGGELNRLGHSLSRDAKADALPRLLFLGQIARYGLTVSYWEAVDRLNHVADGQAGWDSTGGLGKCRGRADADDIDLGTATNGRAEVQPSKIAAVVLDRSVLLSVELDTFDGCPLVVEII